MGGTEARGAPQGLAFQGGLAFGTKLKAGVGADFFSLTKVPSHEAAGDLPSRSLACEQERSGSVHFHLPGILHRTLLSPLRLFYTRLTIFRCQGRATHVHVKVHTKWEPHANGTFTVSPIATASL